MKHSLIRPIIRPILQKLIHQITMRTMYLHPIEPCLLHRIFRRLRIPSHVLFDLSRGQRAWRNGSTTERNISGTDIGVCERWVFGEELSGIRSAADGPELDDDE